MGWVCLLQLAAVVAVYTNYGTMEWGLCVCVCSAATVVGVVAVYMNSGDYVCVCVCPAATVVGVVAVYMNYGVSLLGTGEVNTSFNSFPAKMGVVATLLWLLQPEFDFTEVRRDLLSSPPNPHPLPLPSLHM